MVDSNDTPEKQHDRWHKEATVHQKSVEIFNTHQEDTRRRVDTMARTIFIVGGGALTISIGLFLRKEIQPIPPDVIFILQSSWIALVYSVIAFVFVMGFMVLGSYILGERWRCQLVEREAKEKEVDDTSNWPRWTERPQWFFGVTGLLALFYGLGALAWVAASLLGRQI